MFALLEILGVLLEFLFGLAELVSGWMEWRAKRARRMEVGTHVDKQES